MPIVDDIHCLFTAEVENQYGSYLIEIPENEIEHGAISPGETFKVALLGRLDQGENNTNDRGRARARDGPPVEKGDVVDVKIDDIGEQGDGIARIGPGYIVFVPNTEIGDQVTIEITQAQDSFGFGELTSSRL